ncbi:MAG: hypothetical protein K2X03_11630 [Bryobacteraceae bacterium]|nr:hypothetical protein [Bryobacteraceae bacterium]
MKYALSLMLLSVSVLAQDADPARGLISSDFLAAVDPLGTRVAQTTLTVVYLDNARDDQFVDVGVIRSDVTALIRAVSPASLPPEAFAKAIAKGLGDKYPQIAGLTVTLYLNFNAQGSPQYVTALTRLAPTLPASVKAVVTRHLAARANESAQSRIVR